MSLAESSTVTGKVVLIPDVTRDGRGGSDIKHG